MNRYQTIILALIGNALIFSAAAPAATADPSSDAGSGPYATQYRTLTVQNLEIFYRTNRT